MPKHYSMSDPDSKFGKDTYAGGKKKKAKKGYHRMPDGSMMKGEKHGNKGKGKKMSKAEFLKMVREKKYKKK